MPQFTQWQIVDPTPNVLFNPMAIDESIAKQRSELGNLDINRQDLQLRQDEFARTKAFGESLAKAIPTDGVTGTTGAGGGGSSAEVPAEYLPYYREASARTGIPVEVLIAQHKQESGFNPNAIGAAGEIGIGQILPSTARSPGFGMQGIDPATLRDPRTNINFSADYLKARGGPRTDFSNPATVDAALKNYNGGGDPNYVANVRRYVPGAAARAAQAPAQVQPPTPPPFNPYAGPRVAGQPPAGAPGPTDALGFDPLNHMRGAPSITGGAPTVTGQADPASMEAVKKASIALLAMPEADAAVAYGPTVRALQAQGLAMNAPPVYPGHAALQAIVGQTETAAPAVEPSRLAMRLDGTDTAGPGAGQVTMAPVEQPNTLYQTGLPGISIRGPGNALAPPPAASPPVVTAAAPVAPAGNAPPGATRPPLEAPPAAPSRVVQREPTIQSGVFAGLTRTQAQTIAQTAAAGAKPAVVMQQIAEQRHQNDVIRQGDATQAAIEQQQNYERQEAYRKAQIEAVKSAEAQRHTAETERVAQEQLRLQQEDAALKARADKRAEEAAKQANLPNGWRLGEDGKTAYRVAGLPSETKPLPENERKNLLDGGGKLDQVITAQTTFHPTYAGYTFAKAGDLDNLLKAKAGESPQADWWQGYQRYKLAVRQGISGQSLTASELSEFDKADINPGMAPSTIQHNLQLQRELTERIHNRRVKSLEADGYSPEAIKAAGGERPAAPARPTTDPLAAARDAISKGAPRDAVIKRLRENGIDPGGL